MANVRRIRTPATQYYFEPYDHQQIIAKMHEEFSRVSEKVIGRELIILQFACALLTRQHVMLLGRTGIAKSLLANELFEIFKASGAKTFSIKASAEDTKDNYFGPIDIPRYRDEGVKVRRTRGSVLEADFAFVDELFDTNEQILRDIMLLLSDRMLFEGNERYHARLHSLMAATNYLRLNEVTEAVVDRFAYRSVITAETNTFDQYRIDRSFMGQQRGGHGPTKPISRGEIDYLSRVVCGQMGDINIEISDEVLYLKNIILRYFIDRMKKAKGSYYLSPRRQAGVINHLRAWALLNGRTRVEETDLPKMNLMLCMVGAEDEEEKIFAKTAEETIRYLHNDADFRQQLVILTTILNVIEILKANPKRAGSIDLQALGVLPPQKRWREEMAEKLAKKGSLDLTVEQLRSVLSEIKPNNLYIQELAEGCHKQLQELAALHLGGGGQILWTH
ncbi:MAG: AAA family ATPase [Candidatus Lernaella stagnicola]|nr:AAA family ATPase [Candidatus Lernaella stagnicola]